MITPSQIVASPETITAPPITAPALPAAATQAFTVGRDSEGHWLAVGEGGRAGGFFTTREAAMRYAAFETGFQAGAIRLSAGPVALRL